MNLPNIDGGLATIIGSVITALFTIFAVILSTKRSASISPKTGAEPKKSHLGSILERKIITVGRVQHPPLCGYTWDGQGNVTFSGYYVELCKRMCSNTGLSVHFVPVDWSDIPGNVFTDMNLDIVLSVFQTVARQRAAEFVASYHKVNICALKRSDNTKVVNQSDLGKPDVRIVVTKGEAGWEYVTIDLQIPRHRVIVVETSSITEMMEFVATGKADIAVCDEPSCISYAEQNTNVSILFASEPLETCRNGVMIRRGDEEFRNWLDREFQKARLDRVLVELNESIITNSKLGIRRFG